MLTSCDRETSAENNQIAESIGTVSKPMKSRNRQESRSDPSSPRNCRVRTQCALRGDGSKRHGDGIKPYRGTALPDSRRFFELIIGFNVLLGAVSFICSLTISSARCCSRSTASSCAVACPPSISPAYSSAG